MRSYISIFFPKWEGFEKTYSLGIWALQFTPLVGIDSDLLLAFKIKTLNTLSPLYNGLVLDISGTQRLFGGEMVLARVILKRLLLLDIYAKLALAPTIGASWALSRYSKNTISLHKEGSISQTISTFPVEALRLSDKISPSLSEIGIYTLGDLFKIPRNSLLKRFGPELIKRIEEALGEREEGISFIHPEKQFKIKREFETPLGNNEGIKSAILVLFQKLLSRLSLSEKKASSFVIHLKILNIKGEESTLKKTISLYSGIKDFKNLPSIIQPILDSISIEGEVKSILILAEDLERATKEEFCFLLSENHSSSPEEFISMLSVKLGRENIKKAILHESYLPEKAFSYIPIEYKEKFKKDTTTKHLKFGRPTHLFMPPENISVSLEPLQTFPHSFIWRGGKYNLIHGGIPEMISDEWWHKECKRETSEREYYTVQDHTGRWLWIFHDKLNSSWFLQGIWA